MLASPRDCIHLMSTLLGWRPLRHAPTNARITESLSHDNIHEIKIWKCPILTPCGYTRYRYRSISPMITSMKSTQTTVGYMISSFFNFLYCVHSKNTQISAMARVGRRGSRGGVLGVVTPPCSRPPILFFNKLFN